MSGASQLNRTRCPDFDFEWDIECVAKVQDSKMNARQLIAIATPQNTSKRTKILIAVIRTR